MRRHIHSSLILGALLASGGFDPGAAPQGLPQVPRFRGRREHTSFTAGRRSQSLKERSNRRKASRKAKAKK